jgi:hypothetical protein
VLPPARSYSVARETSPSWAISVWGVIEIPSGSDCGHQSIARTALPRPEGLRASSVAILTIMTSFRRFCQAAPIGENVRRVDRGDGYVIAHRDELERTGGWSLVRRALEIESFGVNLVEIAPGESIPEHDETGCSVLIVSAPTTSGYTPMEWA